MGVSNSNGSWWHISPSPNILTHPEVHSQITNLLEFLVHDLSPAVGVSSIPGILINSSLVELDDANDEPKDPTFRSIQELLNSTPRLLDYPNVPELSKEPKPRDLFCLDPMHQDSVCFSNALLTSVGVVIQEPQTYQEAISSIDSISWQKAMDQEYASLIENQTWELVLKPFDRKPVQNKWVYKVK